MLPLPLIIAALVGWIEREQRDLIEFLREENRVLKAELHGRRMRLSDDERRRLAVIGQRLGRRVLAHVATIVTPDTILRWHRELIARKWTSVRSRPGRAGVQVEIRRLAIRMATDNPSWGCTRIQGALKNVGHRVARSTIAKILKEQGIPPSRERPMTWRTFLRAHWQALFAADFFTTEVLDPIAAWFLADYRSGNPDFQTSPSNPSLILGCRQTLAFWRVVETENRLKRGRIVAGLTPGHLRCSG